MWAAVVDCSLACCWDIFLASRCSLGALVLLLLLCCCCCCRPADGAVTAAGNVVVAEAHMFAALFWLRNADLPELLALLVPPSVGQGARQPSPLGSANQKRVSFTAELADDSKLQDSCQRAFRTVLEFELAQVVQPQAMVDAYVAEREGLVQAAFQLAAQLDLAEEVVFDAVLLMDRVMSTGTAHDSNLGSLFVAASLRVSRWCWGQGQERLWLCRRWR